MEDMNTLRSKIRQIIMEYEMGSNKFYMHGEGGDNFPYEDEDKKDKEEIENVLHKSVELGMEPITGNGLHQTGANM